MRRSLVIGNWKMNGSLASATALAATVARGLDAVTGVDAAVCPPFVHLPAVATAIRGSSLALGAQNAAREPQGAFTGEVSVAMLAEVGCRYVLVGHSERRTLFGETSREVAAKFARVLDAGLVPIACVGESLDERERGATHDVVGGQVDALIGHVGAEGLGSGLVAYEPIWAIGTGKTATPEQADEVHAFIRDRIAGASPAVAADLRILYGGSVKADNATELFARNHIDGGLVGGASLNAEEFLRICTAAGNA